MIKEKIKICTSWDDVSINKFMEVSEYLKKKDTDAIKHNFVLLSLLSNMPYDYWFHVPVPTMFECLSKIKFISEKPKAIAKTSYNINGEEYHVNYDISKFKAGQYIDICTLLKECPERYDKLLACIMYPKGSEYDGFDKTYKLIGEYLSIADAVSISGFFLRIFLILIEATLNSSIYQNKKNIKKNREKKISEKRIAELMKVKEQIHLVQNGDMLG